MLRNDAASAHCDLGLGTDDGTLVTSYVELSRTDMGNGWTQVVYKDGGVTIIRRLKFADDRAIREAAYFMFKGKGFQAFPLVDTIDMRYHETPFT